MLSKRDDTRKSQAQGGETEEEGKTMEDIRKK